jgi:hypothetical protein
MKGLHSVRRGGLGVNFSSLLEEIKKPENLGFF